MSQSGVLTVITSGSGSTVETLTGNSGGAVGPDGVFNINVIGNNTSGINIVGMPGTNTLTVVGTQATTTQRGTVTLATNAETLTGTDTSKVLTPDDLTAKLGAQTLHALPIGAGNTAALTWTAAPTNGQLLIGSTGNNPALANITSTAGTITVTNGPGTINIDLVGGTTGIDSFSPNSGTDPVVPTAAGLVNVRGSGSITTVGSLNTITAQLTGLTNHSLLVGAGTATITNLGVATNGQIPIGSTGADPTLATLTAGAGITITNAAGSITIANSTGAFTWSDTSGTVTAVAENGYFITAVTTSTLPASPAEGDTVKYIVDTASALTITAAGTQKIRVGNTLSAATGTTVNTQQGDAMTLVYRTSGTTWFAENFVGAWTTT